MCRLLSRLLRASWGRHRDPDLGQQPPAVSRFSPQPGNQRRPEQRRWRRRTEEEKEENKAENKPSHSTSLRELAGLNTVSLSPCSSSSAFLSGTSHHRPPLSLIFKHAFLPQDGGRAHCHPHPRSHSVNASPCVCRLTAGQPAEIIRRQFHTLQSEMRYSNFTQPPE